MDPGVAYNSVSIFQGVNIASSAGGGDKLEACNLAVQV
jgi:hypothetical protein